MQTFDIIIVGAGVMGSAIAAYLLKADPHLNILIIERDSTYTHSSTVRSDGNLRQSLPSILLRTASKCPQTPLRCCSVPI